MDWLAVTDVLFVTEDTVLFTDRKPPFVSGAKLSRRSPDILCVVGIKRYCASSIIILKISACPSDGADTSYQNNTTCLDISYIFKTAKTVSDQNPITGVTAIHPAGSG